MNIQDVVLETDSSLKLGSHYSFRELFEAVQQQRGRAMRVGTLDQLDASDGLCAIWIKQDDCDLILHVPSDSVLHKQQFLLHELAHMLLGHCDDDDVVVDGMLLTSVPEALLARLLTRKDFSSEAEIAAELLADRFASKIRESAFPNSGYTEIFG